MPKKKKGTSTQSRGQESVSDVQIASSVSAPLASSPPSPTGTAPTLPHLPKSSRSAEEVHATTTESSAQPNRPSAAQSTAQATHEIAIASPLASSAPQYTSPPPSRTPPSILLHASPQNSPLSSSAYGDYLGATPATSASERTTPATTPASEASVPLPNGWNNSPWQRVAAAYSSSPGINAMDLPLLVDSGSESPFDPRGWSGSKKRIGGVGLRSIVEGGMTRGPPAQTTGAAGPEGHALQGAGYSLDQRVGGQRDIPSEREVITSADVDATGKPKGPQPEFWYTQSPGGRYYYFGASPPVPGNGASPPFPANYTGTPHALASLQGIGENTAGGMDEKSGLRRRSNGMHAQPDGAEPPASKDGGLGTSGQVPAYTTEAKGGPPKFRQRRFWHSMDLSTEASGRRGLGVSALATGEPLYEAEGERYSQLSPLARTAPISAQQENVEEPPVERAAVPIPPLHPSTLPRAPHGRRKRGPPEGALARLATEQSLVNMRAHPPPKSLPGVRTASLRDSLTAPSGTSNGARVSSLPPSQGRSRRLRPVAEWRSSSRERRERSGEWERGEEGEEEPSWKAPLREALLGRRGSREVEEEKVAELIQRPMRVARQVSGEEEEIGADFGAGESLRSTGREAELGEGWIPGYVPDEEAGVIGRVANWIRRLWEGVPSDAPAPLFRTSHSSEVGYGDRESDDEMEPRMRMSSGIGTSEERHEGERDRRVFSRKKKRSPRSYETRTSGGGTSQGVTPTTAIPTEEMVESPPSPIVTPPFTPVDALQYSPSEAPPEPPSYVSSPIIPTLLPRSPLEQQQTGGGKYRSLSSIDSPAREGLRGSEVGDRRGRGRRAETRGRRAQSFRMPTPTMQEQNAKIRKILEEDRRERRRLLRAAFPPFRPKHRLPSPWRLALFFLAALGVYAICDAAIRWLPIYHEYFSEQAGGARVPVGIRGRPREPPWMQGKFDSSDIGKGNAILDSAWALMEYTLRPLRAKTRDILGSGRAKVKEAEPMKDRSGKVSTARDTDTGLGSATEVFPLTGTKDIAKRREYLQRDLEKNIISPPDAETLWETTPHSLNVNMDFRTLKEERTTPDTTKGATSARQRPSVLEEAEPRMLQPESTPVVGRRHPPIIPRDRYRSIHTSTDKVVEHHERRLEQEFPHLQEFNESNLLSDEGNRGNGSGQPEHFEERLLQGPREKARSQGDRRPLSHRQAQKPRRLVHEHTNPDEAFPRGINPVEERSAKDASGKTHGPTHEEGESEYGRQKYKPSGPGGIVKKKSKNLESHAMPTVADFGTERKKEKEREKGNAPIILSGLQGIIEGIRRKLTQGMVKIRPQFGVQAAEPTVHPDLGTHPNVRPNTEAVEEVMVSDEGAGIAEAVTDEEGAVAVEHELKRTADERTKESERIAAMNEELQSAPAPVPDPRDTREAAKTKYKGEQLVFADEFDGPLDTTLWKHEISMSGYGNWEFEVYTNNITNTFTRDGFLYIKPGLMTDVGIPIEGIGESGVYAHDIWGTDPASLCTAPQWNGCMRGAARNARPKQVVNPVTSGRIRTAESFAFRYGRLEVRARLPKGDWLWPAIWLLPRTQAYGPWPASGEIDMIESRGNKSPYPGGANTVGTALHWGSDYSTNRYTYTVQEYTLPDGQDFTSDFHIFGLVWDPYRLYSYVDVDDEAHRILTVEFPRDNSLEQYIPAAYPRDKENRNLLGSTPAPDTASSMWDWLNLEKSNRASPWVSGGPNAPFDQEFYLIMNVAVGGTLYFPAGVGGRPWDNSEAAMGQFYGSMRQWLPTWSEVDPNSPGRTRISDNAAMVVDYVRVWQRPNAYYQYPDPTTISQGRHITQMEPYPLGKQGFAYSRVWPQHWGLDFVYEEEEEEKPPVVPPGGEEAVCCPSTYLSDEFLDSGLCMVKVNVSVDIWGDCKGALISGKKATII